MGNAGDHIPDLRNDHPGIPPGSRIVASLELDKPALGGVSRARIGNLEQIGSGSKPREQDLVPYRTME